jgi:hypothetical protein
MKTTYLVKSLEVSDFNLIQMAFNLGWKVPDTRLMGGKTIVQGAIEFLVSKNVSITVIPGTIEAKQDIPLLPAPSAKLEDNAMMKCYVDDTIYEFDSAMLGDECWEVQLFGNLGCKGCASKNKKDCDGEMVLSSGVNSLGNKIPIAVKIGDRPRREKKIFGMVVG